MKYPVADLKAYYASKRGFTTWASMAADQQVAGLNQMNQLYDLIWYWKGGWGFNGSKQQLSLIAPLGNTVSGTVGERVITFGTAVNASYYGISLVGQYVSIGGRLFRLAYRRSSTVYTLDAPLLATASAAACTIYFVRYPLSYRIGAIRNAKRNQDTLDYVPEVMTPADFTSGTPDFAYNAGRLEQDFLSSGTLTVSSTNPNRFVYTGTVSVDHIGMTLLVKKSGAYQYFTVIDVETTGGAGTNYFIVDRDYTGANEASLTFALNPAGLQMIGFKDLPSATELIELSFTFAPNKLINDADLTQLPDDTPMLAGIEVLGTKWETVGERGFINEVMFQDKKFKESLKVLNLRGTPLQNRLFSMLDMKNMTRFARNSNPWNTRG